MTSAGDFRPRSAPRRGAESGAGPPGSGPGAMGPQGSTTPRPASRGELARALAWAALGAAAWAILRGILDLSVGLLVIAAASGWALGAELRGRRWARGLAALLAVAAWLGSLALTWLLTRLVLPASDLDPLERLARTPLLDYTLQQAGLLELASLVLFLGAAIASVGRTRPAAA